MSRSAWELLKQQRLHAWQPLLTPARVAIGFVILSVLFIPIGSVVLVADKKVTEIAVRYDDMHRCTAAENLGSFTFKGNGAVLRTGCQTRVTFEITETLEAPVYLYYGLTKFYQNHRRYAKSRSDAQLAGKDVKPNEMADASPLVVPGVMNDMSNVSVKYQNKTLRYEDFVYVPAGLIAWSMFNDSFVLFKRTGSAATDLTLICNGTDFSRGTNLPLGGSAQPNKCRKKGIAWEKDVAKKFKTPPFDSPVHNYWSAPRHLYADADAESFVSNDSFVNNGWYAGELGHSVPVTTDEDLMVWMRSASLPSFRKLHRVIETDLTPGHYVMEIAEFFDVTSFGGSKTFTLSTLSWFGGKNTFIGITYIAVGGVALIFAALFFIISHFSEVRASKSLEELLAN